MREEHAAGAEKDLVQFGHARAEARRAIGRAAASEKVRHDLVDGRDHVGIIRQGS